MPEGSTPGASDPVPQGATPCDTPERPVAANGLTAFEFQREVWSAYLHGESGLVHSATGSGKTLAAWLGPLAEWTQGEGGDKAPAIRVVWITPMRALAADTAASLERAVKGLDLPWTVGLRTGDTSSGE